MAELLTTARVAPASPAQSPLANQPPEAFELLEGLARTGAAAALESDPDGVARALAEAVWAFFKPDLVHVALAEGDVLRTAATKGMPSFLAEEWATIPLDGALLPCEAARTGEVQIVGDVAEGESWRPFFRATGLRYLASAPLIVDGAVLGVITLARAAAQPPSPAQRDAARAVAHFFGVALANVRARQRAAAASEQLERVLHASLRMEEAREPGDVIRAAAAAAREVTGAAAAAVAVSGPGGKPVWTYSGAALDLLNSIGRAGSPLGDRREAALRRGDALLGRIYVAQKQDGEFTEADERALQLLANHTSAVLEQARAAARLADEVAQRRRAEAELRESEESLRRILEGVAAHAIFTTEPGGRIVTWNAAAERVTGYSTHEALGMPLAQLCPAEEAERVRASLERASHGLVAEEAPRLRKDGTRFWADVSISPLQGDDGKLRGHVHVLRDVSERRALLEQLEAERAWLKTVFDRAPVALLFMKGAAAPFDMVGNARAEQDYGPIGSDTRVGGSEGRVFYPDGRAVPFHELPGPRAALRGEEVGPIELVMEGADGVRRDIRVVSSPIRAADGATLGAILAWENVTAAHEAARLREEWGSMVAHELRQPLNDLGLAAQVFARAKELPASLHERAAGLAASVRRLDRLVGDLFSASLLEAGRLEVRREPCDLVALVRAAVAATPGREERSAVRVEVRGEPSPVELDRDRIGQVLANLLSNAAKHGRGGAVEVAVEFRDGEAEVCVANDGPPIPAEELPLLFERFRRATPSRDLPGTGLGLYVCRGLVGAHGGRIWAESPPGGPVRFRFTLPRG